MTELDQHLANAQQYAMANQDRLAILAILALIAAIRHMADGKTSK